MVVQNKDFLNLGAASDRFEVCANLINKSDVEIFAEIGVWRGEFAAYILEHCPSIKRYYMIDPWAHLEDWNKPANTSSERFNKHYETAMEVTEFAAERRFVCRTTTVEAMSTFEPEYFDAIYIDGDHTLRGISTDLISSYGKVKQGGLIIGDDFSPTIWQHPEKYEPTLVFPFAVHFAEAKQCPIYAVPYNQFVLHKTSEGGFCFFDTTHMYPKTSLLEQINK